MAIYDGIFDAIGNQYGGAVGGLASTLRPNASPFFGGIPGSRQRNAGGPKKVDPRGMPMMVRDNRLASLNYKMTGSRLNFIPAAKFLFFVRFVRPLGTGFNSVTDKSKILGSGPDWAQGMGFTTKRIDRPSMGIQTQVMNQYNKKRVIQTKVEYEPISITFYDTYDQRVHRMFMEYFSYYYGDGDKLPGSWTYDVTGRDFLGGDWGFSPNKIANPNDGNFFSHIEIYTFGGGMYTRMDIINPKITKFNPSDLSYEEGVVTQEITMSLEYEGVVFHNEGVATRFNASLLELSGLGASQFYETEDNPFPGDFADGWAKNPPVAQPDILENLLNTVTGNLIAGKPVTGQTVSNSVLNSFGKFNFGQGGMSGGNNTMGSLLTTGTSGLTSGSSGKQILGGSLTSAGFGPVAGAVTGGNYTGLALAGALGAAGSVFSGNNPSASAGSRIQWNDSPTSISGNTQTLAAMNQQGIVWQNDANTYNSAQQAQTFADYRSYSAAAQNLQQARNDGSSTLPSAEQYRSEFDRIRNSYRGV